MHVSFRSGKASLHFRTALDSWKSSLGQKFSQKENRLGCFERAQRPGGVSERHWEAPSACEIV